MEYLAGETLKDRLKRRGPLQPCEAVTVFRQVLEALAAAHDAGIIHRDMKPENVFLMDRDDAPPLVKLLDFGISKFTDGSEAHSLTMAGTILGSPYYMSPEQANGGLEVGPLSDIYSVGVMLHESLTGAVPFDAATFSALVIKIATQRPPHPSDEMPTIPRDLGDIVLQVMARSPSERFQSARALSAALGNLELPPDIPTREIPQTLIPPSRKKKGAVPIPDPFATAGHRQQGIPEAEFPPTLGDDDANLDDPGPTQVIKSPFDESALAQGGFPEPDFETIELNPDEQSRPTDPLLDYREPQSEASSSYQLATPPTSMQMRAVNEPSGSFQATKILSGAEASNPSFQAVQLPRGAEASNASFQAVQLPSFDESSRSSFQVSTEGGRTPMSWTQEEADDQRKRILMYVGAGILLFLLFAASGVAVVFIGLPLTRGNPPSSPASPTDEAIIIPQDPSTGDDAGPDQQPGTTPSGDASASMREDQGDGAPGIEVLEYADASSPLEAAPPTTETIRVSISVTPDHGRILLDGEPVEGNPAEVTLPANGARHEIRATARGHRPGVERFDATEDRQIEMVLHRRRSGSSSNPQEGGGEGPLINPWGQQ
jgi:serine/threonine protein kinase